jgi:hypothetical protein
MFSKVSVSVAVLTLLCNAAFAVIPTCPPDFKLQYQDFSIGSTNLVGLVGAGGQATSTNNAMILNTQADTKLCSTAYQDALVVFVQSGCVVGSCGGLWDVQQLAMVGGEQIQLVGDGCGSKIETQGLMVGLTQMVTKVDGSGDATGSHTLAVVQNQAAVNSAGTMNESSVVLAGQLSGVIGGPSTSGQATSNLTVGTTQTQLDM